MGVNTLSESSLVAFSIAPGGGVRMLPSEIFKGVQGSHGSTHARA